MAAYNRRQVREMNLFAAAMNDPSKLPKAPPTEAELADDPFDRDTSWAVRKRRD